MSIYSGSSKCIDTDKYREVYRIKLNCIYILIGIATVALNLILTVHLLRNLKSPVCRNTTEADEVITFRLVREHDTAGVTTAAVPYDETVPMEEDI